MIDTERLLKNDMIIFLGNRNEGKTMFLANLIRDYTNKYSGEVHTFGMRPEITDKLKVKTFNSIIELEKIKNSIIIIDEVGIIFDLEDRKKRGMIEGILRLLSHNGNRILLAGVPDDFKKFLCSKAKCFIFRTTNINDLINGSMAKEIIKQYRGNDIGYYSLELPQDEVLCYDQHFFKEKFEYIKEFDTKLENVDLFVEKSCKERTEKSGNKVNK